jgi:hypothetical protein
MNILENKFFFTFFMSAFSCGIAGLILATIEDITEKKALHGNQSALLTVGIIGFWSIVSIVGHFKEKNQQTNKEGLDK